MARFLYLPDKYFGYLLLLLICLVKLFLVHIRNEPVFKITAVSLLGFALIILAAIFLWARYVERKHKMEMDKWIAQNSGQRKMKLQKLLFDRIGLVAAIIILNAFAFFIIVYLLDWPMTYVFIVAAVVISSIKRYLKSRKIVIDK